MKFYSITDDNRILFSAKLRQRESVECATRINREVSRERARSDIVSHRERVSMTAIVNELSRIERLEGVGTVTGCCYCSGSSRNVIIE